MPRGKATPDHVKLAIIDVAIRLKDTVASHRWPTEGEVRQELQRLTSDSVPPPISERLGMDYKEIPPPRSIYEILREPKKRWGKEGPLPSDLDKRWNLGLSVWYDIPSDATGALLDVWEWAFTNATATPFSVRTAKWIDRLRWVARAGGNSQGEATDPGQLYGWAVFYAGREWKVETITDDTKGMRSGVLDALLMLGPTVSGFARRQGLLEDNQGINHDEEFEGIDPAYVRYLRRLHQYEATREVDLTTFRSELTSGVYGLYNIDKVNAIWKEFAAYDSTLWEKHKHDAAAIFNIKHKQLSNDERFWQIKQHDPLMIEMLRSLFESYKKEQMESWEPDLEQLIQKHLLIND